MDRLDEDAHYERRALLHCVDIPCSGDPLTWTIGRVPLSPDDLELAYACTAEDFAAVARILEGELRDPYDVLKSLLDGDGGAD